ncbi:MAG: hypothetical protein MJ220_00950 [Bacilli bacterium]|nr:hypothetical protein [Bacilli bacterium]
MNIMANLKNAKFGIAIPACILSLVGFVSVLVGVILYSSNCASEFNGGAVSGNVVSLGTAAIILAGIALLGLIASLFLAKNEKTAYLFSYARFGNFAAFVLSLGAFFFQILDEYSLIGTILYPIVSGAVGDPVDPVLSGSYFSALGLLLVAMIVSMVAGCLVSHRAKRLLAKEAK